MKEIFDAHWCVNRRTKVKARWRPYSSVVCSMCTSSSESIDMAFPDREAYDKAVRKDEEENLLDDGWRN